MHKLTVDGQEYFFPTVSTLKIDILDAIRSGGGYVTVAAPNDLEILFSSGTSVSWSSFEVEPRSDDEREDTFPNIDFDVY